MAGVEFFISYAGADQAWAEWIAWQLESAGHTTRLQAWDFGVGSDFVHQMEHALRDAERLVAVLSPAYLASRFGEAEWRPVFAKDPTGELGLLLPVRVAACDPPALLTTRVYLDLVGMAEADAAERLLAAVRQGPRPGRPQTAPIFPGVAAPAGAGMPPPFPGPGPSVSNLAPRNPHFTGRDQLLNQLEAQLAGGTVAVVAAHGLGGVGKTQLALEYAHRHADDYDVVWWVPAEIRLLAIGSLAELALRLGLPARAEQAEQASAALAALAGRDRWLLVFDNGEDPKDLEGLWPAGGGGRVVVTSRNPAWGGHASRLAVDVLAEQEATGFLLGRTGSSDRQAAQALATELGGLPLALEQAAAYLEETDLELDEYLGRYRRYHAELLARGRPTRYPATVATTWQLNLEQLADDQAAGDLLRLCAFLGPEAIPLGLLAADPSLLPPGLGAAVADELALDQVVAVLYRFSLVGRDHDGLRLHRLVQAVVRADLAGQEPVWAAVALRLVLAGFPSDSEEVTTWAICERLLAHAQAVSAHAERLGVAPEQTAELLDRVGSYLASRAQFGAAKESLERALVIAEATYHSNHAVVGGLFNNLALVREDLGDLAGAKTSLERALAINEAVYGPDHPEVATDINNLGSVLQGLGDLAGARACFERALAIDEAALGPDDLQVAPILTNLGLVLFHLGDLPEARVNCERALVIAEAALGPDHPNVAISVNNLGLVLQGLGDLAGARERFERALAIDEAALGPDHPKVATDYNNLGLVLLHLGDSVEARANSERALRIDEAALGSDHPMVARDLNNLGDVLLKLGDPAGAKASFERALAIYTQAYGADHRATQRVAHKLEKP